MSVCFAENYISKNMSDYRNSRIFSETDNSLMYVFKSISGKYISRIIGIRQTPVDPPYIKCVQTLSNGNVQLIWLLPDDPDSVFNSYHVFYSGNYIGPYAVIDSLFSYYQTSWIHTGANGNNQTGYYYIRTRSEGNNFSVNTSDTVCNILLNISLLNPNIAYMTWNPVKIPLIPSNNPYYFIYRDTGSGIYQLIDSTFGLYYYDTITVCDGNVLYKIRQYDSSTCYSESNTDNEYFSDVIPPDTPVLDFVSVDSFTQKPYLQWQPSYAPDTESYIVYRYNAGWIPLDTVISLNYIDLLGLPDVNYESYRIAAIDSCKNTSPMSLEHRTIFLSTEKNICDDKVTLSWTPYINLSNSLVSYEIYFNIDDGVFELLDVLSPSQTMYEHTGLLDYAQYCYYVKAINNDGTKTAVSNIRCEKIIKPPKPNFAYIRYVTVVDNNYVKIAVYADNAAHITGYRIQKAVNNSGIYSNIAELPPSPQTYVYYNDYQVQPGNNIYTYRFIVKDSCGADALVSEKASTIKLKGEPGNEFFTNKIQWSEYEGWPSVAYYEVYRIINNVSELIAEVSPLEFSFLDNYGLDLTGNTDKVSYYVIAYEEDGNIYGFSETSVSNTISVVMFPVIYVANAFTPGGLNPVFKPVVHFVDFSNYFFGIYNRVGAEIFHTTDINEGWDGTYKGNYVKNDVYTWKLKTKFPDGTNLVKYGVVTVIR